MEYRINRNNGDKISVIGLGAAGIYESGHEAGVEILKKAYENGINYYDLAGARKELFDLYGEAFGNERRKNVRYQLHFGAVYDRGNYGWTLNADAIKRNVERELKQLRTDYIDYGFIHCIDEMSVWDMYKKKGILDMIMSYRDQGIVKNIGLSSHTPVVAEKILDEVGANMLMFSINPAYDYHHGNFANGTGDERNHLYRKCEKNGIGITVMKVYAGGQLLDPRQSIFGQALTEIQCIKYALDKPGVLTVLPGVSSMEQLGKVLRYCDAEKEETDYSIISKAVAKDMEGKCVYCNHCAPCPAGIDVGLVNKYYDLANVGDDMAVSHYKNLDKHASDCIQCGHCNSRCPFRVDQMKVMLKIKEYMKF